jgi:hypothetical protein
MSATTRAFQISAAPAREVPSVKLIRLAGRLAIGLAVAILFATAVLTSVGMTRTAVGPTLERGLVSLIQPHAAGPQGR